MICAQESSGRNHEDMERYISLMAAGDRDALAALYGMASSPVYGFALSILRNAQDAEDVLQDAFIRIWQSAGGYTPQGKPMAWILTITKNLAASRLRARAKTSNLGDDEWQMFYVESPAVTREDRLVLSAALGGLDETERQIVMLHGLSGLKHAEIAELLGMPLSTVLSKYSRSRVKLQRLLREESQ